jgi:hypothetical protein
VGLAGCGGSGTNTYTLTLLSEAELDGYITHMFAEPEVYVTNSVDPSFQVGYSNSGFTKIGLKGFVSFNLSSLPEGATITSAVLRVYQYNVAGDPYDKLGKVLVEHVSYDSLEQGESGETAQAKYTMEPLDNTIPADAFLSTDATIGYKTLDVTAAVQADQGASRTRAQFRLRFPKEIVDEDIYSPVSAYFISGDNDTNQPQLVIKYTL